MAIKSSFIYPRFIAINELNFPFYQTTHFNKHLINILQSLDNFEYFPDMVVPFQQFIPGENAQEISFLLLLLCPILNCPVPRLFFSLFCSCHGTNGIFLHGHFLMTLLNNNPESGRLTDQVSKKGRKAGQRDEKETESLSKRDYK